MPAETGHQLIIIGSGPAGLTAAIYAARAALRPLVLAGSPWGGQLMLTSDVENYPGYADGILGPSMMEDFRAQAERFGAEIRLVDVTSVDFTHSPFTLQTDEATLTASAVIVATGASAKWLNVPGEELLRGRGVSACATCDGFFFRDQRVAVIGGGDSALEEALFLTRFTTQVTVVHRRGQVRASRILQQRAHANPKIDFRWNSVVEAILGEDQVTGVRLRDVATSETHVLPVAGVFVAIGHQPNTALFTDQLDLDPVGYVLSPDPGTTATNVPGVFAAGDVRDHRYRQAVTAAGDGCKAAMDAERWLEGHGFAIPDLAAEIYPLPPLSEAEAPASECQEM